MLDWTCSAVIMALRELPSAFRSLATRDVRPLTASIAWNCRRYASAGTAIKEEAPSDFQDLELQSSFAVKLPSDDGKITEFDPVKRAQGRKRELPPSRYEYYVMI